MLAHAGAAAAGADPRRWRAGQLAGRGRGPGRTDRRAGRGQRGAHPPAARRAPVGLSARRRRARRCCSSTPRRRRSRAMRAHGCASTLAFEFSPRRRSGWSSIAAARRSPAGQVPVRIEQGLRATAAHSTLVLGDANSTAVLIDGKLGAGVGEVEIDRRTLRARQAAARRPGSRRATTAMPRAIGLIHRRILILRDDGSELRGEDLLVPAGQQGQARQGRLRDPLPPRPRDRGRPVRRRARRGPGAARRQLLAVPLPASGRRVAASRKACGSMAQGRPQPVQQLVIQGLMSRGGGSFSWLLKKMG